MNLVMITGNLAKKPVLGEFNSTGNKFTVLDIAVNDTIKVKGEWEKVTYWRKVEVFGKRAETCAQYLDKGSKLAVKGKWVTQTTGDGDSKKYYEKIYADEVEFLSPKGENNATPQKKDEVEVPF